MFPEVGFIAINFPLRMAFAASHGFWSVLSLLSFASRYFLISSLIYSVIHWSLSSMLLSLHVFVFFAFFFLRSLAKGLSILLIFSKNQLFVSFIFSMVFFVSISLISALIFMISFLLPTLGLVCSSLWSHFRCKVSLFI